jgi:hypothetical protein
MIANEDFITLREGFNIFSKRYRLNSGETSSKINLVVIHGGPGFDTHKSLMDAFLAVDNNNFSLSNVSSMIFYDQTVLRLIKFINFWSYSYHIVNY